jgi:hypothetical protein
MIIKKMINYLQEVIKTLYQLVSIDRREAFLFNYFKKKFDSSLTSQKIVLVQSVEDIYYYGLFGQIISSLREKDSIRVEQLVPRSLNVGESNSLIIYVKSHCIGGELLSRKWIKLYKSFCNGIAYRSVSYHPIDDIVDWFRSRSCFKSIDTKKKLIELVIDGVVVGDLVNDSYLRFKPAPTVIIKNLYLQIVIWQAYRDIRRAKKYFARKKPKVYLTSYSTYIQHGIAARVALQFGIKVFSFGNFQEFAKELTLTDWVHTKNSDNYLFDFSKMNNKEEKLDFADTALSMRMTGNIDNATAYMKKSAYTVSDEPVPNVKGSVVIFLHDFYDSPHVYKNMIFPDFWEWICFTIDTLNKHNISFFIKPHPNQISLSDSVLADLRQKYNNLKEIPTSITNKQLVEAGMVCAVTVYGTVAHEMAFLGVPTIACGHHPHISFDICNTAKNESEYADFLKNCQKIIFDKAKLRRESLAFYYMHNLSMGEDEQNLRKKYLSFRKACEDIGAKNVDLTNYLKEIANEPGYKKYIEKWQNILTN